MRKGIERKTESAEMEDVKAVVLRFLAKHVQMKTDVRILKVMSNSLYLMYCSPGGTNLIILPVMEKRVSRQIGV